MTVPYNIIIYNPQEGYILSYTFPWKIQRIVVKLSQASVADSTLANVSTFSKARSFFFY